MGDKELVDTRDSAWTACKGSDAERDIAGLRAVAEVAWDEGREFGELPWDDQVTRRQCVCLRPEHHERNPYRKTDTKEAH